MKRYNTTSTPAMRRKQNSMLDRIYTITVKAWFRIDYLSGSSTTLQRSLTQRADLQKVTAVREHHDTRNAMIEAAVKAMSGKLEFEHGCEPSTPLNAVLTVSEQFM